MSDFAVPIKDVEDVRELIDKEMGKKEITYREMAWFCQMSYGGFYSNINRGNLMSVRTMLLALKHLGYHVIAVKNFEGKNE